MILEHADPDCLVPSTSLDLNAQGQPRNWDENCHWKLQDSNWQKDKAATLAIEQLFYRFWDIIAFVATLHLLKLASFLTTCAIVNPKTKESLFNCSCFDFAKTI